MKYLKFKLQFSRSFTQKIY